MLNKLFHFLRAKRREIATGIFVSFVAILGIYYLFFEGRGNNNQTSNLTPTPEKQTSSISQNKDSVTIEQNNYSFQTEPYLLYQVRTRSNVLGYGWAKGKLLYANSDGIFESRVEIPLLDQKISAVSFNSQGKAIVRAGGNNWYIFENGKDLLSVPQQGSLPQLNQAGDYVLSLQEDVLSLYSLLGKNRLEVKLEGKGLSLKTSANSPLALVLSESGSDRAVELIDINQQKQIDKVYVSSDTEIFGVSPSGEKILFITNNEVVVRSRIANEKDIRYKISENATYQGYFVDNNKALLIEKRPKESTFQSGQIYLLDLREEKKEFVVDDKPMLGKINPNIQIFTDSRVEALPIVENKGTLWLVSLVPGKIANYSRNAGLQLLDNVFDPGSFGDNH